MGGDYGKVGLMLKKIILTFLISFVSGMALRAEDNGQSPQQFEGFNLIGYTDDGKKSWDVKGDTADIMGSVINLTNIVANAYGENQANLTAQSGTINQNDGNMHLEKDVVVTTQNGVQMTTDSLNWQRDKDLVSTPDPVTIKDERLTANGTGATAHPSLKTAQMNEDVTVKVNTEANKVNGKVVTIICDGPMEIDQAKQQAVFNNNVVAFQGDRQLKADRIELFFDQKSNQIKAMVCIGHVAITMGENTTYAEKAVYTAESQKLILSGRPKLILLTEGEKGFAAFGN